ncbi:OmpA family protein [Luteolibacter sp. SL250]|uniref:OmpA family protein n=1 Tax=Luteolibacter sp. SL250 TaxID=2995170 RepID=UPI0022707F2A|nr:OmpA family protein [Luteolibacter sp. SL250]WAC21249.1 OmpA family protein [Luteolibacter sp. SL250]
MKRSLLAAIALIFISPLALAKDAAGSKDHPDFKRITGSEIIWHKASKFDELNIALERVEFDYDKQAFKKTKRDKAEGQLTTLYYKLPADSTTLEAVRQYEAELKPAGYETLFTAENDKLDDGYGRFVEQTFPIAKKTGQLQYLHEFNKDEQRYSILKGKGKEGNAIYVSVYAFRLDDVNTGFDKLVEGHKLEKGNVVARVDILETKAMDTRMTAVKAEEITSSIDTEGRIAIYGVFFDTDKSDIKPESAESLAEMAKAISAGKGTYLIVGHTDNQGDLNYNQTLSLKRATAVTAALTGEYKIPADRVIPVGVGMAAPLAPNTDDKGRAKNRRVEIVKM